MQTARYECTVDGHNKWWKYTYDPDSGLLVTEYGSLSSAAVMDNVKEDVPPKQVQALIASKVRKGYVLAPS